MVPDFCLLIIGWRQFKITINEQERNEQLEKLEREITSLQVAMKQKDPSLARDIYLDRGLNWLCRECPYAKECERTRSAEAAA
jgi:hypothetical protein